MEKETTLKFKIYAPIDLEYDGTLSGVYKGVTEEDEPKAVFELKFDKEFLMKRVIAKENEDHQNLLDIIRDINDKEVEMEEKERKLERKNEMKKALRDFCNRLKDDGGNDLSSYCEHYIQQHFDHD